MPSLSEHEFALYEEAMANKSAESTSLGKESKIPPSTPAIAPSLPSHSGEKKYFTLAEAFPNAAVFLMFFDSSLRTGAKMLYPWQIEELIRLSSISDWKTDSKLLYFLLANNGSGKDAFIIAGIVCYVLCCKRRYKVVITSSSDNQLDTQTRVYIKDLAENVNQYMRKEWGWEVDAIDIKNETFKATRGFTGTEVYTFVSKVGGKVEGYHPFPDADPGEGVIIIVNEGKSIPAEIHRHLKKCTYNVWIEVSSAGEASGEFYKAVTNATKYPQKPEPFRPFCRIVTYKDTPHKIREAEEEIKELGEDHPFVKNTYLSKFSSVGAQVTLTEESLDRCKEQCKERIVIGVGRHGGLDFAAGGDECSFYVFDENTLIGYESWRVKDTETTIDLLVGDAERVGFFQKYGFTKETAAKVTGDDNGLGEPIINSLHRQGWGISRVKNQGAARRKDRYLNRGAELYDSFAKIVAGCFINWNKKLHPKLHRQLTNRHYTIEGQAKFKLVDKKDEAESPDHADAVVLAWNGISILDFLDEKVVKPAARTPSPILGTVPLIRPSIVSALETKYRLEALIRNQESSSIKQARNPISILRSIYG